MSAAVRKGTSFMKHPINFNLNGRPMTLNVDDDRTLPQSSRRRPRPNENCPLRIRCASSMPAIVMAAFANDLNPAIDAQRRLIAR